MSDFSHVANAHPQYIEGLYNAYLQDPNAIDPSWSHFFKGFDYYADNYNGNGKENGQTAVAALPQTGLTTIPKKELAVMSIIDGYRHRGHLLSTTNPVRKRKDRGAHLNLSDFGLSDADLETRFVAGETLGLANATLKEIIHRLNGIYCGNIGYEYSHIDKHEQRLWLRAEIEKHSHTQDYNLSLDKKRRILKKLNEAVGFEEFLGKKFIGKKRFSLEGGESTIAALDAIINTGVDDRVEEVVIGMAHRGRLNVLANIMQKTYENIFNEFEETVGHLSYGSGDVKYHLGFSSQVETINGKSVYLKLLPNPSHLEAVDPLVVGYARAKADILYDHDYDRILPIMIHGDAAVAGQGIVYEVAQMSDLKGYYAGGTVHFVINNQIGFTTDFDDARTSTYCSSVANTIQAPTFHVNGDDPEAVVFACELAVKYRQQFNTDVFIDMVCYRRWGHNESDNPAFTQPLLWSIIEKHPNPREIYIAELTGRNVVSKDLAETMKAEYYQFLQERLDNVKQKQLPYKYQDPDMAWRSLKRGDQITDDLYENSPATGIDRAEIDVIFNNLNTLPDGFEPLKDVLRYLQGKQKLLGDNKVDWGYGELLAYASILRGGKNVRLSGEDVKRGTFSHRHACFFDAKSNVEYNRLSKLSETQGQFYIYNSLLSEYAVLGFEYGYALSSPDNLVIWEAQFGDFNNGAQTIIDQFIIAGESKWGRQNGLVLLLPHGYEGQGPEHSSARLERFMQLCAENNITVANCTTPANFFHLIRRQLAREFRKPLIHLSPKSLLRHPECVSPVEDFETGKGFQEVIDDTQTEGKVKKVLFCSGKVYYDLWAKKRADNRTDIAVVRVEQLYPFPAIKIAAIQAKHAEASYHWVQEEPMNNGAWSYIAVFHADLGLRYIGRPVSASPATGFVKVHTKEQEALVAKAFG
jgi:2-oxoglutarate dehydrogenase E1 component